MEEFYSIFGEMDDKLKIDKDKAFKITKIEVLPIYGKLKFPFKTANVVNYEMKSAVVKVYSDHGVVGIGESTPAWEVTGETQESILDVVQNFFIPQISYIIDQKEKEPSNEENHLNGGRIENLSDIEYLCHNFNPLSRDGVPELVNYNGAAKCGLETALFDLFARELGVPLYLIFKDVRKELIPEWSELEGVIEKKEFGKGDYLKRKTPIVLSGGVIGSDNLNESLKLAEFQIALGAKSMKIKVGVNPKREIEIIKELRKKYPPDVLKLNLDANQGFKDVNQVVSFLNQVSAYDIEYLEQPMYAANLDAFLQIKEEIDFKLAADESVMNYYQAKYLIDNKGVDIINLKLMKHGGFRETLDILQLCQQNHIQCKLGSMIENSVGSAMNYHFYMGNNYLFETDLLSLMAYEKPYLKGVNFKDFGLYCKNSLGNGIIIE
ncbi:MAG: mandelate racemase/muconate lactonizing enzyme family protein [Promethearchaeota archaeon]